MGIVVVGKGGVVVSGSPFSIRAITSPAVTTAPFSRSSSTSTPEAGAEISRIEADIDGLNAITDEKSGTVARMTELAHTRLHAMAAADATETWVELLALTQSAQEINRVNGLLINTHLTRNQVALSVLHGADQRSGFYGPDGQAKIPVTARNLVIG